MPKKLIYFGAEAKIFFENNKIIKKRIRKKYRHGKIDDAIRKGRTRQEGRIMEKLAKIGIKVPKIIEIKNFEIKMEFINGAVLRDVINNIERKILCKIGESIALMHNNDVIHGDLTPSNIIVKNHEIFFIDFGLSFHSKRIEDKSVDLHVLKEALESSFQNFEDLWNEILEGYGKKSNNFNEIKRRMEEIERRGRYKKLKDLL